VEKEKHAVDGLDIAKLRERIVLGIIIALWCSRRFDVHRERPEG
jgi:hypothetical protein